MACSSLMTAPGACGFTAKTTASPAMATRSQSPGALNRALPLADAPLAWFCAKPRRGNRGYKERQATKDATGTKEICFRLRVLCVLCGLRVTTLLFLPRRPERD